MSCGLGLVMSFQEKIVFSTASAQKTEALHKDASAYGERDANAIASPTDKQKNLLIKS